MRALSLRQARNCENAKHPRCKCRCHGVLHGASRSQVMTEAQPSRAWFEALPADDPHHLPTKEERRAKRRKRDRQRYGGPDLFERDT